VAGLVLSSTADDSEDRSIAPAVDRMRSDATLFEHAVAPARSAQLSPLSSTSRRGPSRQASDTNRILGFGELRRGAAILHFPTRADAGTCVFALERWRR
jgi:hypothetical protein